MNPKYLFLTLLVLLTSITVSAYEWTDANGTVWSFTTSGSNATLYKGYNTPCISGVIPTDLIIPSKVYISENAYNVTSIENYAFYGCSSLTSITLPDGVTSIGQSAFYDCSGLTSFTFPNNLTSIGMHAFYKCSGLTSITIPNSVTGIGWDPFGYCYNLASINVESGNNVYDSRGDCNAIIETETNELISGCKNTIIPNSVTSIGNGAFDGCYGLTSITIPNGVTSIREGAFNSCAGLTSITIPSSVTSIGEGAFYYCPLLTTITIPNGVTSIEPWTFCNCYNLTSITIPNGVTNIGEGAFCSCHSLTSFTFPTSVTNIGDDAFNGCSSLTSVTAMIYPPVDITNRGVFGNLSGCVLQIPSGTKDAYMNAGWGKPGWNIVEQDISGTCGEGVTWTLDIVTETLTISGIGAMYWYTSPNFPLHVRVTAPWFEHRNYFSKVVIEEGVTSIGSYSFMECTGVTSITIPESVTSIGYSAFKETAWFENQSDGMLYINDIAYVYKGTPSDNEEIIIQEGTKSLSGYAFSGCTSQFSITFPNSVTSIGGSAFDGCSGLTSITIPNSVTSIGGSAFNGCSSLTSVTMESETPISIGSSTFSNRANATLNVPAGSKAAYEAADYWMEFKEIVEIVPPSPTITFADPNVKAICVANWDTNGDGELSEAEAAAVTDLGEAFKENTEITSFDELQYFTGLTELQHTFSGCENLSSCLIPKNVKIVGVHAFHYCNSLEQLTIPGNVTEIGGEAMADCSNLQSITISEGVTKIGEGALRNCISLTSVKIPKSVIDCSEVPIWGGSIESIIVEDGNPVYDSRNNCNAIIETATNTLINGCKGTIIPNGITAIGIHAFVGHNGLKEITIPNSVKKIGARAFWGTGLTSICIPEGVEEIESEAFSAISSLHSVMLPASLSKVNSNPFDKRAMTVVVAEGNPVYDSRDNCNAVIETISNKLIAGCRGTIIPNSVTSIGENAFYEYMGVDIPSITIPQSVNSIGDGAFSNCIITNSLKVDIATPLLISLNTFTNPANTTLIVPAGSKAAYQAADYWNEFKRIIEFIEGDVNGDENVNVADVVDIARYVVGTPAETFVQILADINNNGEVNLGDAVCLVNMIAGDQNLVKAMHAPRRVEVSEEALTLTLTDEGLSLSLENQRGYTAFQFDLYVPEAMDVTSMLLNAQRKQRHQLLYNKVEDGHWRVAAISTSNHAFNGHAGELLSIAVNSIANDDISIRNIRFFDTQSNEYEFDDICLSGTATNIEDLTPSSKGEASVYDLQGRKVANSQLPKGIYIVNGKKVVRR